MAAHALAAARVLHRRLHEELPELERVLASAAILASASADEADRWYLGDEVMLRARSAATRLAMPVGDRAHEEVSSC